MGKLKIYPQVKLITSIFTNDLNLMNQALNCMSNHFGEIDLETDLLPFEFTSYYSKELGTNLKRKIISFKELISADDLASIKLYTNSLEEFLSGADQGERKIDLDPGYICTDKLILATTKDRSHRIYLSQGIFGEVTLKYNNGRFEPWEWTYKSYQSEDHLEFLSKVRKLYLSQLKEIKVAE